MSPLIDPDISIFEAAAANSRQPLLYTLFTFFLLYHGVKLHEDGIASLSLLLKTDELEPILFLLIYNNSSWPAMRTTCTRCRLRTFCLSEESRVLERVIVEVSSGRTRIGEDREGLQGLSSDENRSRILFVKAKRFI
jgi:hypothetical protein